MKKEAAIIASTDLHHLLKTDQTYLFVDVGGGSTEFICFLMVNWSIQDRSKQERYY
jgi:exopolyphosphatase/pppGpp-phosphohydrolase